MATGYEALWLIFGVLALCLVPALIAAWISIREYVQWVRAGRPNHAKIAYEEKYGKKASNQ